MKTFKNGQRVILDQPEMHKALRGKIGTVVRLRRCDNGAWVRMDEDVPDELRSFPANDEAGRGNHVMLYPEECSPANDGGKP